MEESTSVVQGHGVTETYTVQPSSEGQFHKPSSSYNSLMVLPFLMMAVWLFIVIFFTVMVYKFVKATERIANKFEEGIKIQKDVSNQ